HTSATSTSASDAGAGGRRDGTSPQRTSVGDRTFGAVATTILTIWALMVFLPRLWTFYSSFKNSREILTSPFSLPAELSVENFVNAWTEAGIGRFFGNTRIVVGCALFLVMLLGAMCAYVLARSSFPGRRLSYYGLIGGLTFPLCLAVVPLFFVLEWLSLRYTYIGLILAYAV